MNRSSVKPLLRARAFSLIELVIVVVIIGIVAAIAIPRLSSATGNTNDASLAANLAILNKAAEMYAAEHNQQNIGQEPDGSPSTDPDTVANRLIRKTLDTGAFSDSARFGPYLRGMPVNPFNGLNNIRIGSINTLTNTGGWVFDPSSNSFASDFSSAIAEAPLPPHAHPGGGAAAAGADLLPN